MLVDKRGRAHLLIKELTQEAIEDLYKTGVQDE